MGWMGHSVFHETIHTGNFHRKGYLMLHHLAGATIELANLVNYNCHPQDDGSVLGTILFLVCISMTFLTLSPLYHEAFC